MTASLSGIFSLQEFTDLGAPLVGGRVYTYTQGTTTHKTAYTDKAGSIAHTYTSDGVGGQYIGLNARGELPASLYLAAGSYDITLKDSTGATIWTRRADPVDDSASAIRADLASTSDASKGAGMVGVDLTRNYVAGTIGALLRESAVNVRGAPYYAGGVAVNDATAIQAAIDANPSGAIYIPKPPNGARDYSLTSGLSIATAATTWIYGDETLINVTGDITALTVTDVAGVKGGIVGIHFYQTSNTYSSGGKVDFAAAPNSIGIKCRDTFQFRIINCTVEQFGVGLLLNNYAYWCEGTYLQGVWLRNNKVGWKCLREGSGTDSLSHTQAWGVKIQIPRDNTGGVAGNWCDGLVIDGGGVGALQIYNAFLNIHFWTGDAASAPYAGSGNFVKLLNVGRIAGSFLTWTFERYGKINIAASSYIDQPTCHVFMSSLDAAQLEITDANATGAKFRSYYVGNISKNLNFPGAFSNWRGSGNAGTYQHGESFSSATGHHYVNGTGISSHLLTHLSGSSNGVFFAATADHEGNLGLPHAFVLERGAGFPTLRLTGNASNPGHIKAAATGAGPTSYTCAQGIGHFYLTGCVSPLTVTLPSDSDANDGQLITIVTDANVATLSWLAPNGASRATLPVAATANTPIRAIYSNVDNAWYPA